jgi:hypothetical protein
METQPASSKMFSLLVLFDMHTTYFKKAIHAISDKDAHDRLGTKANHVAWIAGSLVHERFELAKQFGTSQEKETAYELFKDHQGIKEDATYPSLSEMEKDWEKISPVLRKIYAELTDEKLDSSFEMMPGHKMTHFDLVSFMTYREANCIGQLALWRRLLGYEAINYM